MRTPFLPTVATHFCAWFFVLSCVGSLSHVATLHGEEKLEFNQHVRPILNQHCVACHGGVKKFGDLSFVYGDEASYVVEPGDPDASILIERVTTDDPDLHMPPAEHGKPLTESEIATLRTWIEQGGTWGKHWAFEPPRPRDSEQQAEPWCRQPIDGFVLGQLKAAGLQPEKEASHERWLRRVTLDLTGLPPTPGEREAFLSACEESQDTEKTYADEVDRLLQSSALGERWASVWLDVIRYADSKGLGLDGKRTIWKYRDWVIKAFNNDMPYDEFTVKQIAGDLLPNATIEDVLATASQRLTQTCEEGGTDDEMFRVEAVLDRVNTTMLAWQGLSFGCVQCHAHPYDPIEHDEYYRMVSFFNNSADCDLGEEFPTLAVPVEDGQLEEAHQLDQAISEIEVKAWQQAYDMLTQQMQWEPLSGFSVESNNSTKVVVQQVDGETEYQTRGTVAKNTTVTIESELPADLTSLTAVRFTGLPRDLEQAFRDSEWGFVISHMNIELLRGQDDPKPLRIATVIGDEPQMLLDPVQSLDAKSSKGFGAYTRIHHPRTGFFPFEEAVAIQEGDRLRVSMKQNVFALGAFPLVAHRGRLAVSGESEYLKWRNAAASRAKREELSQLKKQRKAIRSVAIPVMRERPRTLARPTFVFDRGNYLSKSESVQSGTPKFLPALSSQESKESPIPSRLELARWIASDANPLTARVFVNRIWAQFFGQGLVLTQEDFGSAGQSASHPALLDDLAWRFMNEMDWSPKKLMREIVLSATYRQSSVVSPHKNELDASNRLLSRGPRYRLPAETIRDQALAIAGLLSQKQFGEPVHPPIPNGVWLPFQGGDKWKTPEKGNPDRYRRSVYTYTKRTIQFPMMASFDAPTREFCSPRRSPSNTPLQALMTLNDATFVEATEAFAKRMMESGEGLEAQIENGFVIATGRKPRAEELRALVELYHSQTSEGAELEALQSVASVLLNLDEVFNK